MVKVTVKSYIKNINGKRVRVKRHSRDVHSTSKSRQIRYKRRFGSSLDRDEIIDIMNFLRIEENLNVKSIKQIKRSPYKLYRIVGINKHTKKMEEWFMVPDDEDLEAMAKHTLGYSFGEYVEAGWIKSSDTIDEAFDKLGAKNIISPPYTGDFNVTRHYGKKLWRVN